LHGHVETQARIKRHQVRVAEQPGWSLFLFQRRLDQLPGHALATLLRVHEQSRQPKAFTHPTQAQACNDARGPCHPQFSVARSTHARAVLAVKVVQQPAFCGREFRAVNIF